MAGSQDTEITLGVGRLFGLFFSLVILCGISLGAGFWLGRNSMKQAAAATPAVAATTPAPAYGSSKPGAAQPTTHVVSPRASDCDGGGNCPTQGAPQGTAAGGATDLTFYQAVQQKDTHPQLAPPPSASGTATPAAPASDARTLGSGYLVQIAAVRNQDDARLLSETLRKQQYPVLISQPGDNLFHVQVGPYADIKEAEAIRSRLVSEGYNPFLKH